MTSVQELIDLLNRAEDRLRERPSGYLDYCRECLADERRDGTIKHKRGCAMRPVQEARRMMERNRQSIIGPTA